MNVIAIEGEITQGDADRFDLIAKSIDGPATVILSQSRRAGCRWFEYWHGNSSSGIRHLGTER